MAGLCANAHEPQELRRDCYGVFDPNRLIFARETLKAVDGQDVSR